MHGRLPWYSPTDLDPARRAVYDAIAGGPRAAGVQAFQLTDEEGRLEGPFNAMLVCPSLGGAVQALGTAVRYGTSLTDRVREIAILTVAAQRRSDFEWYAHSRVALRSGLSDDELSDLREGRSPSTLSPAEDAALAMVRALVTRADLDDEEFAAAIGALGIEQLAELVTLVGYYDLLALSLRVWRTPLPSGEEPMAW